MAESPDPPAMDQTGTSAALAHAAGLPVPEQVALLCSEQEQRWQQGERVLLEEYLEYLPALRDEADAVLYLVIHEVGLREERAETASLDEYLERFPKLSVALRREFALRRGMNSGTVGDHAGATLQGTATAPPTERPGGPSPVVSGYEILGELGRGGMGVVYKARQVGLNRLVALKMILAAEHAGAEGVARFRIEAEAVARLQHTNIVQIHEIGEQDGRPYFSLEFLDGGSLEDQLKAGPQPPRQAAQLVERLARAMHYAHQHNIVHRDLKPANVLLMADGTPKIADFGLAKRMDSQGQTQAGDIMGTPSYMAPEQAASAPDIGPAADIYALGAILYDLLVGRPPFQAAATMDTILQVLHDEPVPPGRLQSKVPRDLETICLRCLAKEPHKRYASAEALADDLARFLKGEPIVARPVGRLERGWRWCKREPRLATALATVFLLLLTVALGATTALIHVRRAQRERALAQVEALLSANPQTVSPIIDGLAPFRDVVDPRLKELRAQPNLSETQRTRAALALLPVDAGQVDYLKRRLLEEEDPPEVLLIRDALAPHAAELSAELWEAVQQRPIDTAMSSRQFRALLALAAYDPANERWARVGGGLVERLLSANPLYLGVWTRALRPVRGALLEPLAHVFRGKAQNEKRRMAAVVLADYAADRLDFLVNLLLDADEREWAVLWPEVDAQRDQALPLLQRELAKAPPAQESDRDLLAKRQAQAAVALLRFHAADTVWPLLQHTSDPRRRSFLIHALGPLGAPPQVLLQRLEQEPDVASRRALILSLGEYGESVWPTTERGTATERIQEIYRSAEDPGLHAAAEWLLRRWQKGDWLRQTTEEWARDRAATAERQERIRQQSARRPGPRWYVTGQAQTMVVVPGPVAFAMGSPPTERGRKPIESQHLERVRRSFAIAATSVTKEQFLRFMPQFSPDAMQYYPDPTCPIGAVTWFEAAGYCNWLSKQEGIDEDQWCYETTPEGDVRALKKNALRLTGYRLPTEAEWEYSCRAGAVTSRYYGQSDELLGEYAWYLQNSPERTSSVASKKPNDLGLFDMHGNMWNWCQERYRDYPGASAKAQPSKDEEEPREINPTEARALRGGSFISQALGVRSARRLRSVAAGRYHDVGFRPARTLP